MPDNKDSPNNDYDKSVPVFYYSREHRLSRAPQRVIDFTEDNSKPPGLLRIIFGKKSNVSILISVAIICALFMMANRSSGKESGSNLGGNLVAVTIFREGDILIMSIDKTAAKTGEVYLGAVDIAVSPAKATAKQGEDIPVFSHRITFNPVDYENYYLSLPFDDKNFYVIIVAGNNQKALRISAKEK